MLPEVGHEGRAARPLDLVVLAAVPLAHVRERQLEVELAEGDERSDCAVVRGLGVARRQMGGSSRASRPFHRPWKDAKQLGGSSQEHGATRSRESPGDEGRIGELCRSKELSLIHISEPTRPY